MSQHPSQEWHNSKLSQRTYHYILGALKDQLEIADFQGHTHAKHNNAQQDSNIWSRPLEGSWLIQGNGSYNNNKNSHIL